jgi:hypothetical protein
VRGEGLLLGIAQIAIVTAGFASLASAFRRDAGHWTQWHAVRLRGLVTATLSATMLSLLPLVLYAALADEGRAFTIASALMTLYIGVIMVVRERQMARAHVVRVRINAFLLLGFAAILVVSVANALWWASLAGFVTALSIELLMAFVLFYSLLAESTATD